MSLASPFTGRRIALEQLLALYRQGTASALWIPTGSRVLDYSGGGHHGTVTGNGVVFDRDPVVGHIVTCVSDGSFLGFGVVGADTDPVTLVALARANRTVGGANQDAIFFRDPDEGGSTQGFGLFIDWNVGALPAFPSAQIVNSAGTQFVAAAASYGATGVSPGGWHHFVGQQDWANNVLRFYVNGVLLASTATTGTTFRSGGAKGWRMFENNAATSSARSSVAYASLRNVVLTTQEVQLEYETARRVFNLV